MTGARRLHDVHDTMCRTDQCLAGHQAKAWLRQTGWQEDENKPQDFPGERVTRNRHLLRWAKGPRRSLLLGAAVSPAMLNEACPWCPELGTWHHTVWACAYSPFPLDLAPPQDPLLARWLWPLGQPATDTAYMNHAAQVLKHLWDLRHRPRQRPAAGA